MASKKKAWEMQAKDSPEAKAEPKTKAFSQGIISDCCVCFTKKFV